MKNLLLINAHQFYEGYSEGKLNQTMVDTISNEMKANGWEVSQTNIEKGYDSNEEVEKHLKANLIVTQAPIYWFGLPWIYKKYVDEVFTTGLVQQSMLADDGRTRKDPDKQYGSGGKMQGKQYMLSLTWNAPVEAFGDDKQYLFEGKSVDDVMVAYTTAYKFCGANILPTFSCYNVVKNPQIEEDIQRLKLHLKENCIDA